MSSLPVSEVIAALNSIFVQSCLNGVIITLLLYDYILTLGREVELFWCRGPTVARVVFFSLRLSVLGAVITTVLDSYVPKYDETIGACTATYNSYIALWFLGAVAVAVITAVRAYVVTDCSYVWTIFTLALGLSSIILNAYYQARMKFHLVELQASITCWESAELPPTFNTIVTLMMLICNTLADAVVIFATWVRTFHIVKLQRQKLRARSIAWLLLRDGTVYFLAVFSVNLAFGLIGAIAGGLSYLSSLISPLQLILLTRLLINLREASEDDIYVDSRDVTSVLSDTTTVELSTPRFSHEDDLNGEITSGRDRSGTHREELDEEASGR